MTKNKEPLPTNCKLALSILDSIRENIYAGKWSDDELLHALNQFHPCSDKEYINPRDYCTADKAMKILNLGYNRNKFFELTRKYHIINYKINNAPLGYKVSEINKLADILNIESKNENSL